jgi:LysR family transcriptional regulator, chromosome initiation inhibitor
MSASWPRIAIAVNADSLATWFEPVAREIAKAKVALELMVDDQDTHCSFLARGEAIGCVSTSDDSPAGFLAAFIGVMEYECVSNAEFAREFFPQGLGLHSVLAAPAVLFNRKDGLHAVFLERLLHLKVKGYAAHYFPSLAALLKAVENGVGEYRGLCRDRLLVPRAGFEPTRLAALPPQDSASTNFATWARGAQLYRQFSVL